MHEMAAVDAAAPRPIAAAAISGMLAIATLATSVPAARADAAACPDRDPSDVEVTRRLAWIDHRVEEIEPDVRMWWSGFVAFQTLLVGVNLTLLVAANDDDGRIDPLVSGAGSVLGLITLFAFFPPMLGAGDLLRSLPRGTPGERLASLRVAEARLRSSAQASSDVRSDISAISSVLYAEAASLTLLFLGQTTGAFMQAGGGIVVGLGRMLLHPTGAIDAWRIYSARHPDAGCVPDEPPAHAEARARFVIAPVGLGSAGGGLALTLAF